MSKSISEILTLKGKDIWVFGGARHLGKATVGFLRKAGAKVLSVDLLSDAASCVTGHNLVVDGGWTAW